MEIHSTKATRIPGVCVEQLVFRRCISPPQRRAHYEVGKINSPCRWAIPQLFQTHSLEGPPSAIGISSSQGRGSEPGKPRAYPYPQLLILCWMHWKIYRHQQFSGILHFSHNHLEFPSVVLAPQAFKIFYGLVSVSHSKSKQLKSFPDYSMCIYTHMCVCKYIYTYLFYHAASSLLTKSTPLWHILKE